MSDPRGDDIVRDYFARLEHALAPLGKGRRDQLLDELKEHVTAARAAPGTDTEVSVREILERLGDPEVIAAEALGREPGELFDKGNHRGKLPRLATRRNGIAFIVLVVVLMIAGTLTAVFASSPTPARSEKTAPVVRVGGFPTGVAVDTAHHTVYVASGDANSLSMIDTKTCNAAMTGGCGTSTTESTGGEDPIGVAVDEATGTVYAVNAGSNTVAVIDANTCNATDRSGCGQSPALVAVPGGPEFLALDAATDTVYVADTSSGTVSVIDGATCNARSTQGCTATPASVAVGPGAFPIAVDQKTNSIYVGTNEGVAVIDGASCDATIVSGCSTRPVVVPMGNEPAGVAVDDAAHAVYVSGEAGTVGVINASTCRAGDTTGCGTTPPTARVGSDPRGDVVDSSLDTVYVTNADSDTVSMLDSATCSASTSSGCGGTSKSFAVGESPRRVVVDPTTGTLYVVNVLDATVSVIGTGTCNAKDEAGCPVAAPPLNRAGEPAASVAGAGGAGGADDNSTCAPTTEASSSGGPASPLAQVSKKVASGTVDGHSWTLWSAHGQSGATGLEDGGLVVDGRAFGLCPGYPNPAELEMLDVGPHAIVAGVIGYPGKATIDLSVSTAGTFDTGHALPSPDVRVVSGVSFFIGALPKSACDYGALELNSTSPAFSAQHNLGFGPCVSNQLVPITESQGEWQFPPGQFPSNSASSPSAIPAVPPATVAVPDDTSTCSPTTVPTSSGGAAGALASSATEVASGTVDGLSWSLWSAHGQSGATGLEDGSLVVDGRAYGLCPGYPNPAELEMLDVGPHAIVAGVIGYPGMAMVDLSVSTAGTFSVGQALPAPEVQVVSGVSFFIGSLPQSACDYGALELNSTSPGVSAQHNLGFAGCVAGELVPITESQGVWQLPPGQFTSS